MLDLQKLMGQMQGMSEQLQREAQQLTVKLDRAETVVLTISDGGEANLKAVGLQNLNLGYVSSDRLKSIAYSAADLFIFPTRADNLPLVLQESMACGTPMVSFRQFKSEAQHLEILA